MIMLRLTEYKCFTPKIFERANIRLE